MRLVLLFATIAEWVLGRTCHIVGVYKFEYRVIVGKLEIMRYVVDHDHEFLRVVLLFPEDVGSLLNLVIGSVIIFLLFAKTHFE